jgi:sulfonate transport system substrate-binding protein
MTGHGHGLRFHRLALALGLVLALSLVAFGAASGPVRAQSGMVRIGFQKFNTTLLVLKAQQELEHRLGDRGYDVTWTEFAAGLPMLEALNAGSIDFAATGAGPPVFAQSAGTDLVYVFASKPAPHTEGILVPKDSPITSVAELQGKKVAVQKGSNAHALLVGSLLAAGLTGDDVEFEFLAPADARAAFEGGSVDAWSIWDPYYAAEEDASGARSITDGEFAGQNNRTFYLASRSFATEHPDAIGALRAAIDAGESWSETHQQDVAKLVSSETGIAEPTLLKVEARSGFGLEPTLSDAVITEQQKLADLFFDVGVIPKKIAVVQATIPEIAVATPTS